MPIFKLRESLTLEEGECLESVEIEYEIEGKLNEEKTNAVVVCHTLVGGIDIVQSPIWSFVGEGRLIDVNKYCVITLGTLGGLNKSTGPRSLDTNGKQYGPDFPTITVTDSVRAHAQVLESLGIKKAKAVIGGSYGGFCAYTWMALKPDYFDLAIIFQSSLCCSAHTIGIFSICRELIVSSPHWKQGHYKESDLKHFHEYTQMIGVNRLFQLSHDKYESKFPRALRRETERRPARYWESYSPVDKFIMSKPSLHKGADPNTMLSTFRASSLFDLETSFPDLWSRWKTLSTTVVQIPCLEDWRYPAEGMLEIHQKMQTIGINSYCYTTSSRWGHGSYLYDPNSLNEIIPILEKLLERSK